jgi:molybdenum cofactor biosynthesis protein MoaC
MTFSCICIDDVAVRSAYMCIWLTLWPDTLKLERSVFRGTPVPSRFPLFNPSFDTMTRTTRMSRLHPSATSLKQTSWIFNATIKQQQLYRFHTLVARQNDDTRLPHLTSKGEAHIVNVSEKAITSRRAIAIGRVVFGSADTSKLIKQALIKKGDVLGTARLAGIMAAKNCPSLIPLCHPITITGVRVDVHLNDASQDDVGGVTVQSEVKCVGQTGVEMEALTSVTGALLTVIDMVKSVDRGSKIDQVRLVLKEGGRSGFWKDESWDAALKH